MHGPDRLRERLVHPSGQCTSGFVGKVMAARQHRYAGAGLEGNAEHVSIGECAAGIRLDTTTSVVRIVGTSTAPTPMDTPPMNSTRPDKRGQASTMARCSVAADGGIVLSTTTASGDESSRMIIICASSP